MCCFQLTFWVISIPLEGFHPIYVTAAIVGAVLLGAFATLVLGITRGEKRAMRIFRAIGKPIPGVGADRMDRSSCRPARRSAPW